MGQIIPWTLQGTGHFQRWAHHALDIIRYGQCLQYLTGEISLLLMEIMTFPLLVSQDYMYLSFKV